MDNKELEKKCDEKGKKIFEECLKQYHCPIFFIPFEYSKVDCYFGKHSVGEIKYRQKEYPTYICEENKVYSLLNDDKPYQFYIVVFDNVIYLWNVQTILTNYRLQVWELPTDLSKEEIIRKPIYLLKTEDCDFVFKKIDDKWHLEKMVL